MRVINVGSVGEAPRGHAPILHADATLIEVGKPFDGGRAPKPPAAAEDAGTDAIKVEQLVIPLGKAA